MRNRIVVFFAAVTLLSLAWVARSPAQPATGSCRTCHPDFAAVLPAGHDAVSEDTIGACLSCHPSTRLAPGATSPFVSRLHQAHQPPRGQGDCLVCHSWSDGKSFGLFGEKASWGAPNREEWQLLKEIMGSWAGSHFLDQLHGQGQVSCGGCHGPAVPGFDTTVANAVCLSCHGPMVQLAAKTEPAEFKDRNPHASHLGEIDCTVCHKAHGPSKVYCLGCHQKFMMTIPGGTPAKGGN